MSGEYVFTYPSVNGPCVERMSDARTLLAYCSGWSTGGGTEGGVLIHRTPDTFHTLLVVSPKEVRAP